MFLFILAIGEFQMTVVFATGALDLGLHHVVYRFRARIKPRCVVFFRFGWVIAKGKSISRIELVKRGVAIDLVATRMARLLPVLIVEGNYDEAKNAPTSSVPHEKTILIMACVLWPFEVLGAVNILDRRRALPPPINSSHELPQLDQHEEPNSFRRTKGTAVCRPSRFEAELIGRG